MYAKTDENYTVTPNTKKYMKKMMQDTERIYIRTTKAKK